MQFFVTGYLSQSFNGHLQVSSCNILLYDNYILVFKLTGVISAPEPLAKSIAVIDICNLSMSQVGGEVLEFVRASVTIANQHYPER